MCDSNQNILVWKNVVFVFECLFENEAEIFYQSDAARVHFVLRRKNAGNFELVSLISKSHATVVSVPGGGGGIILCSSLYDICCLLSYKFQE